MLTETQLKEKLIESSRDNFPPPNLDELTELYPAMLQYIGTADSELRDELIYSAFATWIMRGNLFTFGQLSEIFHITLDDQHLFFRIGEKDTDSVFTRTFSVLLLPPLLIQHRETPYLNPSEVMLVKECLIRYLKEEQDRRGYVPGPGWAHAVAHSADALDDVAQCIELGEKDLREIVQAITVNIIGSEFTYGFGEEERLVTPILAIMRRGLLATAEIELWLKAFIEELQLVQTMPEKLIRRANVQNFLQSLYFRMQWGKVLPELLPVIEQILRKINPYVET